MSLNVKIFIKHYILFVRLNGELDQYSSDNLRIRITELIDEYKIQHLVLNLSELNFMDSSGVGFIIGRYNRLKQVKGQVILCNLNDNIKRLIYLSGLNRICVIKDSEEDVNIYLGVA